MLTHFLTILYALLVLWLSAYGLHAWGLVVLYWLHRGRERPAEEVPREQLPTVTVQLPLYNEAHVAERLIDAVAALDYPRDRLQVQVLDDSTDDTTRLVAARVAFHRRQGLDVQVVWRSKRDGFKAGALAHGMRTAEGEYIAIFDADFCPRPDFLLRTIPHLMADPCLGMVQARWSHLNADYSPLTRVQALALDGHFVVEQTARSRAHLPMHFNGTAGVWRRECIEASGGWQSDTLCEDLDLSYRAQIAGWRLAYLPEVEEPAELPPQILAFKRQQARWAQGATQCLRKLLHPLLATPHLGPAQKLMGLLHLSGYLAYPLMVLLLLIAPFFSLHPGAVWNPLRLLAPACLGPLLVYVISQSALYPDWRRRLWALPLLVLVGTGVAWNNTLGVWRGLRQWGGEMERTPKFRLEGQKGDWNDSRYRLARDRAVLGELGLTLYSCAAAWLAWRSGNTAGVPFLLLYGAGFGLVAGMSLWEMLTARRQLLPGRRRMGSDRGKVVEETG